jgi:hypothetical protein
MTRVGLTQDEILKASFESSHIAHRVYLNDDTHLAYDVRLNIRTSQLANQMPGKPLEEFVVCHYISSEG